MSARRSPLFLLEILRTLKARLMLASVVVIAASAWATAMVLLERIEKRSELAVVDLESGHIEQVASLIGQRIVTLQRKLAAAAAALPPEAREDAVVAAEHLGRQAVLMQVLDTLFIADAQGRALAVHDGQRAAPSTLDLSSRDYYQRTLQGVPVVSPPLLGRVSQQRVVMFTVPIYGPGRSVVGVFGGSMRLEERNLFDDITFAARDEQQRATTVVTDAQGLLIAHPQRERLMGSVAGEPLMSSAVAHWVEQGRPVDPAAQVWRDHGAVIVAAGVPGPDWMLFRAVPDIQLLGGLVQAREEAHRWALGVALAGGLVILLLLAYLLGPLSRLRERVRRLDADGDGDGDLEPEGEGRLKEWPQADGEIGELGRVLRQALEDRAKGERQQRRLMHQMRSVMAAAPIGIAITRQRHFELVSAEWSALLGWPDGALVGWPARDIFASHEAYDALGPRVLQAFTAQQPFTDEMEFRRRDGSHFWGRLQGRPVEEGQSQAGTIWLLEDVTHQRAERERLAWSAHHDALTRLFNRRAFEDRLATRLAEPAERGPAVLMALDLDHFKQVNDNAGHAAGDRVLRDVAVVLQQQLRGADIGARLGGDEFVLLLNQGTAAAGLQVADRLCEAIGRLGIEHGSRWLGVGASIGVVEIDPGAGRSAAAWLADADMALYRAKHEGRGRARLAQPAQDLVEPGR
jgi:diguanylate cyclase